MMVSMWTLLDISCNKFENPFYVVAMDVQASENNLIL